MKDTTSTDTTSTDPSDLPTTVRAFLAALAAHETDAAARTFAPDAVVVDQGETYRGTERVREFLTRAGSEFTYTSTLTGTRREDDTHWVAVVRLEGDFPGGVAVVDYRFTLADDLVTGLTIG